MTRMTAAEKTLEKMYEEGWKFERVSSVSQYRYAGTVSPMMTRKGREYCRVHHGETVGKWNYQLTTVLSRPVQE